MKALAEKREIILQRELAFANAVGAAVFEKPSVSFWMVLIPILFLHFIYRMQRFKSGRMKFDEEFMITRRRVMDAALHAMETNQRPDLDNLVLSSGLPEPLQQPYAAWVKVLAEHYIDLLSAEGESFESLVRAAYNNRTNYLLILNRLNTVEKGFYAALKPQMGDTEGAADILNTIESQSRKLRREMSEQCFG